MAAVTLGMFSARGCAIEAFGTVKAREDWQEWRDGVNQQADPQWKGPVKRKPLKHAEPPALILMRDHFPACIILAILVSSVTYVTLMFAFRGVLPPQRGLAAEEEHGRKQQH